MIIKILNYLFNRNKFSLKKKISILAYIENAAFGNGSVVYAFSKVKNSQIGKNTYISYFNNINNCNIGSYCSIAMGVKIGLGKHPQTLLSTSPIFYSPINALKQSLSERNFFSEFQPVQIGNDVLIGVNAIILDGIKIGDGAIIGANSVVTKDVPPYAIVAGSPAKIIRFRFNESIIKSLLEIKWWNKDPGIIKKNAVLFTKEIDKTVLEELSNI
jgi:acetyltransferase-like isoleucine patch superfamily enzyme